MSDAALVAERLVAVQPAAQLALLPARERRHAARLLRVPLDQRQRLQHRVVHAGGHVRALLGADAGGALGVAVEREAPHPRAGDQQQRAGDGAGGEQRRGRALAREQRRPRRAPRARARRRRAARPGRKLPPWRQASASPARDQARSRPPTRSERPSALSSSPPATSASDRRRASACSCRAYAQSAR